MKHRLDNYVANGDGCNAQCSMQLFRNDGDEDEFQGVGFCFWRCIALIVETAFNTHFLSMCFITLFTLSNVCKLTECEYKSFLILRFKRFL